MAQTINTNILTKRQICETRFITQLRSNAKWREQDFVLGAHILYIGEMVLGMLY